MTPRAPWVNDIPIGTCSATTSDAFWAITTEPLSHAWDIAATISTVYQLAAEHPFVGGSKMEPRVLPHLFDSSDPNGAARHIYDSITRVLERGFEELGIETVAEDTFGVIALRIVDDARVGTAYLELKDCSLRLRIVLVDEPRG